MKNYSAQIEITLRASILDVQGKTVEHALHSIGYNGYNNVRIGKFVTLDVKAENEEEARKSLDEACKSLIANPIIEDYKIMINGKDGE